jgi:hypothetical protein
MGRVRFLADHNLNEHIVDGVLRREPAVDFLRIRDVAPVDISDPDLLEWAARNEYMVVSHDVNTMPAYAYERMARGEKATGLLLVKQTQPIGPVIDSLVLIWAATDAEEWRDKVWFLPL